MVGHHLYGDLDHTLGLRFAPGQYELGAAGSQGRASQGTTGEASYAACYSSAEIVVGRSSLVVGQ